MLNLFLCYYSEIPVSSSVRCHLNSHYVSRNTGEIRSENRAFMPPRHDNYVTAFIAVIIRAVALFPAQEYRSSRHAFDTYPRAFASRAADSRLCPRNRRCPRPSVSPGYCSAESHCSSAPSAAVVSPARRTARCSGHLPRVARRPSLRSRCRASRNN